METFKRAGIEFEHEAIHGYYQPEIRQIFYGIYGAL
jgi:hypothetical protein